MSRERRLTKSEQFAAVNYGGTTHYSGLAILKILANGLEYNRYGFVVGRRVGKAVVRNRVRRLLRESARCLASRQGWDVVLIARRQADQAGYYEIKRVVNQLLTRAGLAASEGGLSNQA